MFDIFAIDFLAGMIFVRVSFGYLFALELVADT